jgi:hypothetical protein
MNRRRRLIFPFLIVLGVAALGLITYIQNANIEQLRSQGKDYQVGTTVVTPPKNGESAYQLAVDSGFQGSVADWLISLVAAPIKGDQGNPGNDGLTAYQVAQKNGYSGSVVAWLSSLQGAPGANAPAITDAQIAAAVTAYCSNGACQGVAGLNGVGTNGTNGENPVLACVTRSNTPPTPPTTEYLAWKYPSEPDSAYRDLYTVPATSVCTSSVDLTTPVVPVGPAS